LEKKLKIIADFEGETRTMNIRRELGTPSTTVKVTSGGKQKRSTNRNILIRFNSVGICSICIKYAYTVLLQISYSEKINNSKTKNATTNLSSVKRHCQVSVINARCGFLVSLRKCPTSKLFHPTSV
jgi:hypothetical protein